MDCTKCKLKGCRSGQPCVDNSGAYLDQYADFDNREIVKASSALVDNGRAGTLSRLEEIAEYAGLRGYEKLGVAYCYGLEKYAELLRRYFDKRGIKTVFVSCTVDGVTESAVDPDKASRSVSCNPIGQAAVLNDAGVGLTLLVGLCLGHDILLQKNLTMDFTTFAVKDRVYDNNPLKALVEFAKTEEGV
jgi:uncharacterized metal-binding protein